LLDEFSGGDREVKERMQQALHADVALARRWALDASLLEFVQRARNAGAVHGHPVRRASARRNVESG
jgi:hypothetical protein